MEIETDKFIQDIRDKVGITEDDILNNKIERIREMHSNGINVKNKIKWSANRGEIVNFSTKDYYTIEWMLRLALKELQEQIKLKRQF